MVHLRHCFSAGVYLARLSDQEDRFLGSRRVQPGALSSSLQLLNMARSQVLHLVLRSQPWCLGRMTRERRKRAGYKAHEGKLREAVSRMYS